MAAGVGSGAGGSLGSAALRALAALRFAALRCRWAARWAVHQRPACAAARAACLPACAKDRLNENWVARMTDSASAVTTRMNAPVRFNCDMSMAAMPYPA